MSLADGWVQLANGDVWTGHDRNAKPVLYRVKDGWMVSGVRSADELRAIAVLAAADAASAHTGSKVL